MRGQKPGFSVYVTTDPMKVVCSEFMTTSLKKVLFLDNEIYLNQFSQDFSLIKFQYKSRIRCTYINPNDEIIRIYVPVFVFHDDTAIPYTEEDYRKMR